ncbi:MAG: hypothetical protein WDO70_05850 [Alphaproteobacteria bacterium]
MGCKIFQIFLMAVAIASPAWAQEPQPVVQGDIAYIDGGVSLEERDALGAVRKDYNLLILNTSKNGEFLAADHFMIRSGKGQELLNIADAGPWIYVKLPPGSYKIEASVGGEHQKKNVQISKGKTANLHLTWE